jgi:hypothetical protein
MRARFWCLLVLVFLVPCLPRLVAWLRPEPADPRVLPDSAVRSDETSSNILPEDYVGPEKCASCHQKKFEQWSGHPHRIMNQLPSQRSVRGDFENHLLDLNGCSATFSREGETYRIRLARGAEEVRRYRVTRTVGSRYMQFYIGVQESGPEPPGHVVYREHMLPFAWWITLGRWFPKAFFDLDGPEQLKDGVPLVEGIDKLTDLRPYTDHCMNCHNTFAYAYRIYNPVYAGFPDATVAACIGPLSQALAPTIAVKPTVKGFQRLNDRLDPEKHLVTLGISCESCHLGGREHALEGKAIHFRPTSPLVQILDRDPERSVVDDRYSAPAINGICSQCHSGNASFYPNGSAQFNSREGLDFQIGACSSQMHCAHCHDPHVQGPPSGGPTNPKHLARCLECHPKYRDAEESARHTRHGAASGVNCLDCHMPRQTLGLDTLIRTHRIGKPVEESMMAQGTVNACNLCHLDRSFRWTLTELERGWGTKMTPGRSWKSNPLLDRPAGEVWLESDEAALRLVTGLSYARSPLGKGAMPALLAALNDSEPINRVYAGRAVEQVWGRKLSRADYELLAPPARRLEQIDRLLEKWRAERKR